MGKVNRDRAPHVTSLVGITLTLLQRNARLRVEEVNRLARSAQCQGVPNGQRRARVNDGDEVMAAGREVDVFVVTKKLDDLYGSA